MSNKLLWIGATLVLLVIAITYWPVVHAGFVLDDVIDFVDHKWLSEGDAWKHYIFKDFNYWTNYFRPLIVAFYTLQVRLFHNAPGPMHAVSLIMHLINTALVGLLAWRCVAISPVQRQPAIAIPLVCMLFYGLHPALSEPVTWIGCQFDLAATLFMLLGLLADFHIQRIWRRAVVVALLFFLAACSKESAATFPLILAIFEWAILIRSQAGESGRPIVRHFVQRNWLTYCAMLLAGVAYLAFRYWGLGEIIHPRTLDYPWLGRFQETCFLYARYWLMVFWPVYGMNPVHEYSPEIFLQLSVSSTLIDVAAVTIAFGSLYLAIWRRSIFACLIVALTFGLLPVLHVIPTAFDPSIYHERYIMTPLAVLCAMIPLIRLPVIRPAWARLVSLGVLTVASLWLVFAVVTIRIAIPSWSNSINFWRWVLAEYPASDTARDDLLVAYVDAGDTANANRMIGQLLVDQNICADCMLSISTLAFDLNNQELASKALGRLRESKELATDKQLYLKYLMATGQLLILQHKLEDAESIFRAVITQTPQDPDPQLKLAKVLTLRGQVAQALQVGEAAIRLLPPAERQAAQDNLKRDMLRAPVVSGK